MLPRNVTASAAAAVAPAVARPAAHFVLARGEVCVGGEDESEEESDEEESEEESESESEEGSDESDHDDDEEEEDDDDE